MIADHLCRQACLVESPVPLLHELRGDHDQDVLAPAYRVFLHESQPHLGLAGTHPIGKHDAAVTVDDAQGAPKAVFLEGRQVHSLWRLLLLVQLVAEELQQRPEIHRSRVEEADIGKEELVEVVLVVGRFLPQRVEPVDGALRDLGIVVNKAEFQVLPHSGGRQVGGSDQGRTGIDLVTEEVRLAMQELLDVPADLDVGALQPVGDSHQLLQLAAGRKP